MVEMFRKKTTMTLQHPDILENRSFSMEKYEEVDAYMTEENLVSYMIEAAVKLC